MLFAIVVTLVAGWGEHPDVRCVPEYGTAPAARGISPPATASLATFPAAADLDDDGRGGLPSPWAAVASTAAPVPSARSHLLRGRTPLDRVVLFCRFTC